MNIKDIPDSFDEWRKIKNAYETTSVVYHPANWQCADPTIKYLVSRLPLANIMMPFVYKFLPCFLEDSECRAFGIDTANGFTRSIFNMIIFLRARFIRYFCLPRTMFDLRTPFYANDKGKYVPNYFICKPTIYHDGYRVEELGPEKFLPKCPVFHGSS